MDRPEKSPQERFDAAVAYFRSLLPVAEIIDTPEKAAAEGVPLGTTVKRVRPAELIPSPQLALDAEVVRSMWRDGLIDL